MSDDADHVRDLYRRIYAIVRKIPRGTGSPPTARSPSSPAFPAARASPARR